MHITTVVDMIRCALPTESRYIVVDTETTGLDRFVHQPWEVAWCDITQALTGQRDLDDLPIHEVRLPHTLDGADPVSLEISQYDARTADRAQAASAEQVRALWVDLGGLDERRDKPVIIGSNPAFDQGMLSGLFHRHGLDTDPWYQRPIDIADIAYFAHGITKRGQRPGLSAIAEHLGLATPARHSAAGDVVTTAQALLALAMVPTTVTT